MSYAYDYDYFISYSHADNQSEDGKSGFVDEFVKKLQNSEEHQKMFGRKTEIFFDKTEIHNMSDWDNSIRSRLASSRFFIALLSPGYFKSEYCAREFEWWMQHEMHRRVLGEGTAPMLIVDVAKMYDYQSETIPDIPDKMKTRFPNWLNQIRKIQSGPQFDMHDLDRARISEALDSLREEVKDKVRRQDNAENSLKTGFYPGYNKDFVGRRENLLSLRKSLSEKAAERFSALTGLGGFGKTELALTYGHAFAWDYLLGRVFAKCENKTSISEVLLTSGIAEMFDWELPKGSEQQQITFLFNRLKEKHDKIVQFNVNEGNLRTQGAHILLILDNVNRRELISKNSMSILPDFFHVIITTRENTNDISHIYTELVECLSEDESVELLNNLRPFADLNEAKAARNIAKLLAGFTLVVELTGSYLDKNKHISYQKQYAQLVANHEETFQKMAAKTVDLTRHSAETVDAVLESTLSALSFKARKALDVASMMVPDTVALGWLPELLGLDEDESGDVLNELKGYDILMPLDSEPNIARMHSLVADSIKQKIPEEQQKKIIEIIRDKCNSLLVKDKSFWCASDNSWNITPVSDFCLALARHWTVEASEEEIDWGVTDMLEKSGNTLKSLGKTDDALCVFKEFMRISKERASVFSSDDILKDVGLALSSLGKINYLQGRMETAKELLTQSFLIRQSIAEKQPNHIESQCNLADSYMLLGDIERDRGNSEEAKDYYSEMLKFSENFNAMQDNKVLKNLRTTYKRLFKLEKASGNKAGEWTWYEKALKIVQQLSEKSSDDVDAQLDLSASYALLGDFEKAVGNSLSSQEWYDKALEIDKQLIDKMPEDFQIQQNLSSLYRRLGDLESDSGNKGKALEWYEKAVEIAQCLAEKMPEYVRGLISLSSLYEHLGNLEKKAGNVETARKCYEKALIIIKQLADKMPEDFVLQWGLSVSNFRLGDLEKVAGNISAAREWYEKALVIVEQLAARMPEFVPFQKGLSILYNSLGSLEKAAVNTDAARDWFEKELKNDQRLLDKSPEDVVAQKKLIASYGRLGNLEKMSNNTDSARERFEKALVINKRLADKMPENVEIQQYLSSLYEKLGNLEEDCDNIDSAREWYEKSLDIDKQLADKHPEDVEIQQNLSSSYTNLGELEQYSYNIESAREWYKMALNNDKQLADKHPEDVEIQQNLSSSYTSLGELEEAEGNNDSARSWYEKSLEIDRQLAEKIPEDIRFQKNLSSSYTSLGELENSVGNTTAARVYYKKALDIDKQLADKMPGNIRILWNLSLTYKQLGRLEEAAGNISEARTWYEKAMEIVQLLNKRGDFYSGEAFVLKDLLDNLENDSGNTDSSSR